MDEICFGLSSGHLVTPHRWQRPMHPKLVAPLGLLADAAKNAGFELVVASGFRSFERQQMIWNAKASGQRPLLDTAGQPLNAEALGETERMYAILRWSALPGASRHHWGTDLDVFDRSRMPPGYQLQLTVEETEGQGVCAEFHAWLSDFLASDQNPGFFRPYDRDRGGVAPEPWHLSFAPLSRHYDRSLTLEGLRALLADADLKLKAPVLANLDEIFERFVRVPTQPHR